MIIVHAFVKEIVLIIKSREFIYSPLGYVVTGNLGIVDKLGNFDQLKSYTVGIQI